MKELFGERRFPGCPSDHRIDQWQLGELSGSEGAGISKHVEYCLACRGRLESAANAAAALRNMKGELIRAVVAGARPAPSRRGWLSPALALAAGLAAALVVPSLYHGTDHSERFKGGQSLDLALFRSRAGEVVRLKNGETAAPGDVLRFEVYTPAGRWLMVAGVEAGGAMFLYYPMNERGRAALHEAGGTQLLPAAAELDGSIGHESVLLVSCPSPFELAEIRSETLPAGCETARFELMKEPR